MFTCLNNLVQIEPQSWCYFFVFLKIVGFSTMVVAGAAYFFFFFAWSRSRIEVIRLQSITLKNINCMDIIFYSPLATLLNEFNARLIKRGKMSQFQSMNEEKIFIIGIKLNTFYFIFLIPTSQWCK
jgi:hypothetical protein